MKKRLISFLLVLAMLVGLLPTFVLPAAAITADQMTEAQAWDAGLDVYMAWYNHVWRQNFVEEYYENSLFATLYDEIYPTSDESNDKIRDAYKYFEKHFNFASDTDYLQYNSYLTLLYACFYYYDDQPESQEAKENMGFLAEQLDSINGILSNELVENALSNYLSGGMTNVIVEGPGDFITNAKTWFVTIPNTSTLLEESAGAMGTILGPALSLVTAKNEAAKYVNMGLLNREFTEVLRQLSNNGTDPAMRSAASTLYTAALTDSNATIEDFKIRYAAGQAMTDVMLSQGLSICAKSFADLAGSAAVSGGGAVAAGAFASKVIAGVALGLVLGNLAESIGKGLSEFLVGSESSHTANLDLFFLDNIRSSLYRTYSNALREFNANPCTATARQLNTTAKLMYNVLLCENDYAGLCEDAYYTAGFLKPDWCADLISGGAYSDFLESVQIRNLVLRNLRDRYTQDALDSFSDFTKNHVYTIIYDTNGGSYPALKKIGLQPRQGKIETIPLTLPIEPPVRDDYIFQGWSTVQNSSTVDYLPGAIYTQEGNATLYAVWKRDAAIFYHANRGSGAPASHENTDGPTALSTKEPTRTGFHFLGWDENPAATTPTYPKSAAGTPVTITKEGNVTLYAIWKAGVFDVVFHANGGIFPTSRSDTYVLQKTYLEAFDVLPEQPQYTGYDFVKWTENEDGSGEDYLQGETTTNIGGAGLAAKHLYAQWNKQKTEVTFRYDYSNCTFTDLVLPLTNGSATITLTDPPDEKIAEIGKTFVQWKYYKPSGGFEYYRTGDTLTLTDDMMLYAEWADPAGAPQLSILTDQASYQPGDTAKITITAENTGYFRAQTTGSFRVRNAGGSKASSAVYVESGSASTASALKCYENGSSYTLHVYVPSSCADGAYTVTITASDGTYSEAVDGNISGTQTATISETVAITVNTFQEVSSYVLSYDLNSGYGTVPKTVFFEENEHLVLAEDNAFSREGYTFQGWTKKADGSGTVYKAGRDYQFSTSTTLYAKWKAISGYGQLSLSLGVERYSKVYKPGETANIIVSPNYSNHFYFDARSCSGFTIKNSSGQKAVDGVFIDKTSTDYDSSKEGYSDNSNFYVYVYIPSNCPDGQYTFYVTAANGTLDGSESSSGEKLKKSVTINVRKSDKADAVYLNKTEMTIHLGNEKRLKATIAPSFFSDKEVSWKNSSTSVVSLDDSGNNADIFAKKIGTATITATVDSVSASCKVTVARCSHTEKKIDPEYLATPATCSAQATYYYVCSCGDVGSKTYSYGALPDHTYSDWITIQQPTDNAAGLQQRICSGCGATQQRQTLTLMHAHNTGSAWLSDASGHWKVCTSSSCPDAPGTQIDFHRHDPGTTPTTEAGRMCTVCGYELSPALPVMEITKSGTAAAAYYCVPAGWGECMVVLAGYDASGKLTGTRVRTLTSPDGTPALLTAAGITGTRWQASILRAGTLIPIASATL